MVAVRKHWQYASTPHKHAVLICGFCSYISLIKPQTKGHLMRNSRCRYIRTLLPMAALLCAVKLNAQNLNGTLDASFYGSPLYVQTINTGFGDSTGANDTYNDNGNGSELDAVYSKVSGANLYLFIAGSFQDNGNYLNVFVAGGGSGENTLSVSGGTMQAMNGSVFYPGFQATWAFEMNDYHGTLYSDEYTLAGTPSGGYVGSLAESSPGVAAGSDGGVANLYLNNTLVSTMGTSGTALSGASSGANTTTGLEMVIPLSAIGYTGGPINVLVDINGGGDSYLSNQFLPGLGVGSNNLATASFNFGTAAVATCLCQFSVDMTIIQFTDTNFYAPSLTINGTMNGWSSTGTAMTNNPNAANTNIYTSPYFSLNVGSQAQYQFRYTEGLGGTTIYDHANGAYGGQGNRVFNVPNLFSTNVSAVFNDARFSDYLLQPTPVFFSVDMTNAVGTDSHVFNPAADNVYINGAFIGWYTWAGGVNPTAAPPGFQMMQEGTSTIYTNTIVIPAGTTVDCVYKYGMDPNGNNGGPLDDEAASGDNFSRVIRTFGTSPYPMATDTFTNVYTEPYFSVVNTAGGRLSVGAASHGKVPVQWLGTPGTRLAWKTSVLSGAWQQIPATDGTNWSSGYYSTNGFVSVTNWPATGGPVYFQLEKPY
jgi:hypothetical protein